MEGEDAVLPLRQQLLGLSQQLLFFRNLYRFDEKCGGRLITKIVGVNRRQADKDTLFPQIALCYMATAFYDLGWDVMNTIGKLYLIYTVIDGDCLNWVQLG